MILNPIKSQGINRRFGKCDKESAISPVSVRFSAKRVKIRFIFLIIGFILATFGNTSIFALSAEQQRILDSGIHYYDIEDDCELGSQSSVTLSGGDNIAKVFSFFLSKGYKDFQIAGMLANMSHESGIQPQRLQGTPSGTITLASDVPRDQDGKAWGIVHWDPAHKFIDVAVREGKDPNDLLVQLDFLWRQLEGAVDPSISEKMAGDLFKATTNVGDATTVFEMMFERHAGPPQPERIVAAQKILEEARASGVASAVAVDGGAGDTAPVASLSKVYILGDSITQGAAEKYNQAFTAKNVTPTISAVNGRSWVTPGNPRAGAVGTQGTGRAAVEADRAFVQKADAIVIALGTNGGLGSNPIGEVVGAIRAINSSSPIYWVNIAATAAPVRDIVVPFNTELVRQQSDGKLKVIDWAKAVDLNGVGTNDPNHILADGIHPTATGYQKLVELVVGALLNNTSAIVNSNCATGVNAGVPGNFAATVLAYAWPDYKGGGWIEKMPAYDAAIKKAKAEGRFVGDDGIDCGGFVTTLMIDSGFEPNYNSAGKGLGTVSQLAWLEANWQKIGNDGNVSSSAELQPGDVMIRRSDHGHTYVFVGNIPGFNSVTASASFSVSQSRRRAPMAGRDNVTQDAIWFRKK